MNVKDYHRSLAIKYKETHQIVKGFDVSNLFIQLSAIGLVHAWKPLELEYSHIAIPFIFSLAVYFLLKDFFRTRKLEENMAHMILEGVDLEERNSILEDFFHKILQGINLNTFLFKRSFGNVLPLAILSHSMLQLARDLNPQIVISQWFLGFFAWISGIIFYKLYYDSFKTIRQTKERIFSTQSP